MYTRQVQTELDAWKEIATLRAEGKRVTDPIKVLAPNQRDWVWQYSCELWDGSW